MSVSEQIFFRVDLTPEQAAQAIAEALGGDLQQDDTGVYVGRDNVGGPADYVTGEISVNYHADDVLDSHSALDLYPLMWRIHKKGPHDPDAQQRGARALFDGMTSKLGWPALLVHDLETAIAQWNPQHGLTEFPTETSVDDEMFHHNGPT